MAGASCASEKSSAGRDAAQPMWLLTPGQGAGPRTAHDRRRSGFWNQGAVPVQYRVLTVHYMYWFVSKRFQIRSFPSNARASPHPGSSRSAMDGPSWLQWRTPKKQKTAPGPHGTPKTKEKKNRDTARRRHNRKAAKQHKAAAAMAPGQQTLDQLAAKAQHVTMVNASCTMAFA